MELERKRELERRKTLRLLQVRQQSKDFSCKLRENIQAEMIQQRNKFLQSKTKQIQEQHLEELNKLKQVYEKKLQTIGESHREAAKQPNLDVIKKAKLAQLSTEAAIRGVQARKHQFEKEKQLRHKLEAPQKHKRATRNRENLRSYYVSALPKRSTLGNHLICPRIQPNQTSESIRNNEVLQEIPSNLLNHQSRGRRNLNESYHEYNRKEKSDIIYESNKKNLENNPRGALSPKDCACDYVVCFCHDSPSGIRRRCNSESRGSIGSSVSKEEKEINKIKLRSRSCSPRSVKTLNYCDVGNLYESNQPSFVRVTHHSASPKGEKDSSVVSVEPDLLTEKRSCHKELKKKTEERSSKALHREQLKRDFQKLLLDLGNIAREKLALTKQTKVKHGVYQRERDIVQKNEAKQKKLVEVFETLLHSEKQHNLSEKTDFVHQTEKFATGESSPPTLNLAVYHQINMSSRGSSPTQQGTLTRRIISSEEITISHPSGNAQSQRSPPSRSPPPTQASPRSTTRTPTSSSKPPPYSNSPSGSPRRGQSREPSPEVLVRTDPSGSVHLTVKVQAQGKQHKKKCKRGTSSSKLDSSSSYFSPPESLTPSQKLLLDALLIQVNKRALNKDLKKYIKKLLTMSRESIDDLNVSSSSGGIDPTRNSPEKEIQDDIVKLSELTELYAEKVNTLVDMFENFEQLDSPEQFDTSPQFFDPGPSSSAPWVPQPPRAPPSSRLPVPIRAISPAGQPPARRDASPAGRRVPSPAGQRAPSPASYRGQSPASRGASSPASHRVPSPAGRRAPSPANYQTPSPTSRQAASSATPARSRTPSPIQRLPRKPTTPPMHRRSRRPQTPDPPVRQVGYPPGSADSRIPRLQSPQRSASPQPQRQGTPAPSIQTPFGLSSNLLPLPQDAFRQPDFTPQRPFTLSPPSDISSDLRRILEAPHDPNARRTSSMFRELYPDREIKTPGSSWDFDAELEKHGLADDFRRISQESLQTAVSSSPQNPSSNLKNNRETKNSLPNKSSSANVCVDDIQEELLKFKAFENDNVSPQPFSLNFENIQQRLSDVCNEHYMVVNAILADETEEERERLIKEVWGTENENFFANNQLNTTKSLALLQALKLSS